MTVPLSQKEKWILIEHRLKCTTNKLKWRPRSLVWCTRYTYTPLHRTETAGSYEFVHAKLSILADGRQCSAHTQILLPANESHVVCHRIFICILSVLLSFVALCFPTKTKQCIIRNSVCSVYSRRASWQKKTAEINASHCFGLSGGISRWVECRQSS